jgi:signal peptidase I
VGSRTGFSDDRAKGGEPYRKTVVRDYLETILVCVIFVIFTRAFVFQQSKIPSGSMLDTLLIGDYIMVNRFLYAPTSFEWEENILPVRDVRHGDVVVFKFPSEPETDYIKRVIGLPGDTVELRNGALFRNGIYKEEPYVQEAYRLGDSPRGRNFGPVRVKPGHYFVMGDHRNQSSDSREWGQVDRKLLKGRALLIWYSYEEKPNSHKDSATAQVRSWGSKFIHFFSKSRFSRCFTLIR